jgi:hemerythrin superfamily protein
MSWLDNIGSKVMPMASAEKRAEARRKADELARDNDWLAMILDHHRQIESHVTAILNAATADARRASMKRLALVLTGHSNAEEVTIYPAILEYSGTMSTAMAYEEQEMTKIQMAKLEALDPMSEAWREKMEHIKSSLEQHVYQEEKSWFPEVATKAPREERERLSRRYAEEFERYCGPPREQMQMPLQMAAEESDASVHSDMGNS